MANEYFNCQAKECFGNCFGKCQILTSKIEGKPCPFYKTRKDEMMRDNYIFSVSAGEVITTMFFASCSDHNIEISYNNKDELRCAITVFCNDIKNYLVDYLDVDQDENEGGE